MHPAPLNIQKKGDCRMADEILMKVMTAINGLKRIQNIRWIEVPGFSEWSGFEQKVNHRDAVTVTDVDGNEAVIELHSPENSLHGLDHALIRVLVWMIQMEQSGDSTIPMGHIADMVNPCRRMMSEKANAEKC